MFIVTGCSFFDFSDESAIRRSDIDRANEVRYTVRYGDTLTLIARQHHVPLPTLTAANNIPPPYHIREGDILRIPLGHSAKEIWPSPRRPLDTDMALQPTPVPAPAPGHWQTHALDDDGHYAVEPGESIAKIAARYRLSIADLITANAIEAPYEIFPGQRLVIPLSEDVLQLRAQVQNEILRQEANEAAPSPPLSKRGFSWPVAGSVIRTFEENSVAGESGAINIAAEIGTPVRATNNGIVAFVGTVLDRYGQMIVVRHADDYVSLYAHNDSLRVKQGDVVHQGQVIATVGKSGDVTDSQLRFELRKGLQPIDPKTALVTRYDYLLGSLEPVRDVFER